MVQPAATPLRALPVVLLSPTTSVAVPSLFSSSYRTRASMTAATLVSTALASTALRGRLTLLLRCRRPRRLLFRLLRPLPRPLVLGARPFPSIPPARLCLQRPQARLSPECLCTRQWQLLRRLVRLQLLALPLLRAFRPSGLLRLFTPPARSPSPAVLLL